MRMENAYLRCCSATATAQSQTNPMPKPKPSQGRQDGREGAGSTTTATSCPLTDSTPPSWGRDFDRPEADCAKGHKVRHGESGTASGAGRGSLGREMVRVTNGTAACACATRR